MTSQRQASDGATGKTWLSKLSKDVLAGCINAVISVPDGLASAALAGVNPVLGLYTGVVAPITGSALTSAQLMHISATTASALAAGQVIAAYGPAQREQALVVLVLITGFFLVTFGVLRMGRLIRFVSHAVMIGFLSGVAVLLILHQLAPLLGLKANDGNDLVELLNLFRRSSEFSGTTIVTGLAALAILLGVNRTPVAVFSSIAALAIPTVLVLLLNWDDVTRVADVSPIPSGAPLPVIPDVRLITLRLVFAGFAVAVVIAVQGAGVSETVENPDGSRASASRDMLAQGAANVATAIFSGIPAGGSVGQTAVNASVGAQSRWSGVLSGVWMLIILLLGSRLVGYVPMAVLAILMIVAGVKALDWREAQSIWKTGNAARFPMILTFTATLVLSIPQAVAAGVLLTFVLFLISSAYDVTVWALVRGEDGRIHEQKPPAKLPSNSVTVLDVYGSLFFAGARTLANALPSPIGALRPAVVLRLRGRTSVGSTLIDVLDHYADGLQEVGGRLYLSGVIPQLSEQLRSTGKLDLERVVFVVPAATAVGLSTDQAAERASAWLGSKRAPASSPARMP